MNEELLYAEQAKYREAYANPHYSSGNQGKTLLSNFPGLFAPLFGSRGRFLDIGCGNGLLYSHMIEKGLDAWGIDFVHVLSPFAYKSRFVQANLWDENLLRTLRKQAAFRNRFDFAVCADVMEHIPPEMVATALQNISRLSRVTLFEIANYPSGFGKELHLSLQEADWWIEQMSAFGRPTLLEQKRENVREFLIRFESLQ